MSIKGNNRTRRSPYFNHVFKFNVIITMSNRVIISILFKLFFMNILFNNLFFCMIFYNRQRKNIAILIHCHNKTLIYVTVKTISCLHPIINIIFTLPLVVQINQIFTDIIKMRIPFNIFLRHHFFYPLINKLRKLTRKFHSNSFQRRMKFTFYIFIHYF